VGINAQTMRFLDMFLLYCLQTDSPPDSPAEIVAMAHNQHATAERGREPGLLLERGQGTVPLTDWGTEIVNAMQPIAQLLDATHGGTQYAQALQSAQCGLVQPDTLPSARVLAAIQHEHAGSFTAFVRAQSEHTHAAMLALPQKAEVQARLHQQCVQSVDEQQAIEAADTMPFDVYLSEYLSPLRLRAKPVATGQAIA
jgi:glutamate--cysteine ligase